VNLRKIIDMVHAEVDDTVADSFYVGWVHTAQVNIAKEYGPIKKAEIYYDGYEEPLPNDFIKPAKVVDEDGEEVKYIITPAAEIKFLEDGLYHIYYHAVPDPPPDADDDNFDEWEPEVHEIFHSALVQWCKAEYWDHESSADSEESRFADKFRQRFYQERQENAEVLRQREQTVDHSINVGDPWI